MFLLLLCAGCRRPGRQGNHEWNGLVMGTYVTISVPATDADRLDQAVPEIKQALEAIEADLSIFRPDSEVSRINSNAGSWVEVSTQTAHLVQQSLEYARLSEGAFNPAVLPLVHAWGLHGAQAPPQWLNEATLAPLRELVDWRKLAVESNRVRLAAAGMQLDLGAIAKGYAVDLCYRMLHARSMTNIMVNLGGDLCCSGGTGRNPYWIVGVRNPFNRSQIIGRLLLSGGDAVSTSGNYERFIEIDGRRVAHIIDPRSGYPVEGMAGVTVLAADSLTADALSTALFVMEMQQGGNLVNSMDNCAALFVPDRQPLEIYLTPGMRERFVPEPAFAAAVRQL